MVMYVHWHDVSWKHTLVGSPPAASFLKEVSVLEVWKPLYGGGAKVLIALHLLSRES